VLPDVREEFSLSRKDAKINMSGSACAGLVISPQPFVGRFP
jgi:hypothetical protein